MKIVKAEAIAGKCVNIRGKSASSAEGRHPVIAKRIRRDDDEVRPLVTRFMKKIDSECHDADNQNPRSRVCGSGSKEFSYRFRRQQKRLHSDWDCHDTHGRPKHAQHGYWDTIGKGNLNISGDTAARIEVFVIKRGMQRRVVQKKSERHGEAIERRAPENAPHGKHPVSQIGIEIHAVPHRDAGSTPDQNIAKNDFQL